MADSRSSFTSTHLDGTAMVSVEKVEGESYQGVLVLNTFDGTSTAGRDAAEGYCCLTDSHRVYPRRRAVKHAEGPSISKGLLNLIRNTLSVETSEIW